MRIRWVSYIIHTIEEFSISWKKFQHFHYYFSIAKIDYFQQISLGFSQEAKIQPLVNTNNNVKSGSLTPAFTSITLHTTTITTPANGLLNDEWAKILTCLLDILDIFYALDLLPLDWSHHILDQFKGSKSNAGKMDQTVVYKSIRINAITIFLKLDIQPVPMIMFSNKKIQH